MNAGSLPKKVANNWFGRMHSRKWSAAVVTVDNPAAVTTL